MNIGVLVDEASDRRMYGEVGAAMKDVVLDTISSRLLNRSATQCFLVCACQISPVGVSA